MISPPGRQDFYPGRLPPVRAQWLQLSPLVRAVAISIPLVVVAGFALLDVRAGATVAVLLVGMAAATAVYVKNRTDRHNAAVDRGEIQVAPDPHFRAARYDELPLEVRHRLMALDIGPDDVGRAVRFDQGWIVGRRNPRDVAAIVGDDGGSASFDPRTTTDLWAVSEYNAGRGRDS